MDVLTKLGNRLEKLRLQRGITQEELSREAGLHRTYAGNIERGLENPTIETVSRLAEVLDVSMKTMFDFQSIIEEEQSISAK